MATSSTYYVIDSVECAISWNTTAEAGERFNSMADAEKRARQLAKSEPAKCFHIAQTIKLVECTVSAPQVYGA